LAVLAAVPLALSLASAPARAQYGEPLESPTPAAQNPTTLPGRDRTRVRLFEPSIAVQVTATDNVDLSPEGHRTSDLVTTITPGLHMRWHTAHSTFDGDVAAHVLIYARTGDRHNEIRPDVHMVGNAELVENRVYVDGSVQISQQYLTPFGSRPPGLESVTANRYSSETYRVSPFVRGKSGDVEYEVRDNNVWTNLSQTSSALSGSYVNQVLAHATRTESVLGWSLEYERTEVQFRDQPPFITELGRLRVPYRVSTDLEVSASGGYEHNRYPLITYSDVIYGGGFRWHPNPRTAVDANAEHRFFGTSYLVSLRHRTPLALFTARFSRNVTSYPEQIASLPAGVSVPLVLNEIFRSRIPDPTQRLEFVEQFINDRGLPQVLGEPISIYTQQIYLHESASVSAGWLSARNTVILTVFRSRTEPITASGTALPPPLAGSLNNTQWGGSLTWTTRLRPRLSLVTSLDAYRTESNGLLGVNSEQAFFRSVLTSPIAPNTTAYAGVLAQAFRSTTLASYHEEAIYVGFTHVFH
jgi:uncharacterized protein (PEP-CTERM system associated)